MRMEGSYVRQPLQNVATGSGLEAESYQPAMVSLMHGCARQSNAQEILPGDAGLNRLSPWASVPATLTPHRMLCGPRLTGGGLPWGKARKRDARLDH
jgi:hypothetical protein